MLYFIEILIFDTIEYFDILSMQNYYINKHSAEWPYTVILIMYDSLAIVTFKETRCHLRFKFFKI